MCASTENSARHWRLLFIALETFVVLACIYGLGLRLLWYNDTAAHPLCSMLFRGLERMLFPMLWAFLGASLFLLIVSPFLVRSLRSTAVTAWVVGFVMLLCGILIIFWR